MKNTLSRGKISINGAQIEVEANTAPELAAIISQVISRATGETRTVAKLGRPVGSRSSSTRRSQGSHRKASGPQYTWSDNDILAIARIVMEHGPETPGLTSKVRSFLKEYGDETRRTRASVASYVSRLHLYFYKGSTKNMGPKTLQLLKDSNMNPLTGAEMRGEMETANTMSPQEA
jgi:hypothetical protein